MLGFQYNSCSWFVAHSPKPQRFSSSPRPRTTHTPVWLSDRAGSRPAAAQLQSEAPYGALSRALELLEESLELLC
jgi:hypothetical protein